MSLDESRVNVFSIRRFPAEVREELNRFLRRSSWQCMTREFSIDVLSGLEADGLDKIPDFVDSNYSEFKEEVTARVSVMKSMKRGNIQSTKGKSKVGFHSYFYRYFFI